MFNDWETLLYLVKEGECVLFLGPELPVLDENGQRYDLKEDLVEGIRSKVPEDTLGPDDVVASVGDAAEKLLQSGTAGRVALEIAVKEWYEAAASRRSTLHDRLARLPFSVIVSGSHDPLMEVALKEGAGKEPHVRHYDFHGSFVELAPAADEQHPLLYHLFGHASEPSSLVLTDMQLLDFLTNLISKDPGLPNNVTDVLASGRAFLFLGFGLRHWYLRVLLHYLKILKKPRSPFAVAVEERGREGDAVLFYKNHYGFEVLEQGVVQFVEELATRYVPPPPSEGGAQAEEPFAPAGRRPGAPTVFICHASENAEAARNLNSALEAQHINPWLDKDDLRGGVQWDGLIERTIKEVDYFVVLYSREMAAKAQEASYVNKEIDIALRVAPLHGLKEFIIPAKLDETEPDHRIDKYQTVDLTAEGGHTKLFRAIKREG